MAVNCRMPESNRLREVRKYYWRAGSRDGSAGDVIDNLGIAGTGDADAPYSPNKTLTALMQLLACRLGMQRAMVSIVDEHTQHFLAESTRTLNLADTREFEEGDQLWLGCGGTTRGEALCANTIEVPLMADNKYACFSVTDLSKDPRFWHLPYVAASPNFRYYAGTPLLTKSNIPIGSVFVMDDRPRGPPTQFEIDFLGITARNVMEYLEMRRLSEARERIELMNRGLASFVDGKTSILPPTKVNTEDNGHCQLEVIKKTTSEDPKQVSTISKGSSAAESESFQTSKKLRSAVMEFVKLEESSSHHSDNFKTLPEVEDIQDIPTQDRIFFKAANLLRESLGVNCTMILDVSVPPSKNDAGVIGGNSSTLDGISGTPGLDDVPLFRSTKLNSQFWERVPLGVNQDHTYTKDFDPPGYSRDRDGEGHPTSAKVLSFSSGENSPTGDSTDTRDYNIRSPDYKRLKKLLKLHPKGKLWSFDGLDDEPSEDEETMLALSPKLNRFKENEFATAKFDTVEFLMECFPGARQILFAPLVDIDRGTQVAACFAISFHPTPVFTTTSEVSFLRAFLNSVSASVGLASAAEADRQKGDFISSISHELRSPLHGILASVELLESTVLDRRQKEFCGAISTCGQSLLETITSILEYTKINTLRKDSNQPNRDITKSHVAPEPSSSGNGAIRESLNKSLSLSSIEKDCEDAVTITAAAYMHHSSTPHQPLYRVFVPQEANTDLNGNSTLQWSSISVILNIEYHDWKFSSLPGSFQRIVMNLVGNSLKYTQTGYVKVDLNVRKAIQQGVTEAAENDYIAELNVSDTGKGIGVEFLRTKLYSSFAQESTLAPGTGLGLHLVKSLVQLLHGTIRIESEVGQGTRVNVRLPLRKILADTNPNKTNEPASSSEMDKLVSAVRSNQSPKTFAFHGFMHNPVAGLVRDSLQQYFVNWLKMSAAPDTTSAAIIVVDEESLSGYLSEASNYSPRPKIIVVCDQTRQKYIFKTYNTPNTPIELLTIPFGPRKAAKTILACLETVELSSKLDGVDAAKKSSQTSPASSTPRSEVLLPDGDNPLPTLNVGASISLPMRTTKETKGLRKSRILCVDDNPINLRILKAYMEKLDFHDVICAEDGRAAFDAVRYDKDGFDLILMDLSMPVCDGFQSTSMIRALEEIQLSVLPPNSPKPTPALIVAVTGLASQRDRDAAAAAGADHYCTKPLKLARLKELLNEWGITK